MIYHYFDVEIAPRVKAQFKRNRITRTLYVFQFNCAPDGCNSWHEPGYGWGRWVRV